MYYMSGQVRSVLIEIVLVNTSIGIMIVIGLRWRWIFDQVVGF